MPEAGFAGPVSELNRTTVAYPGSLRTRFNARIPQTHGYSSFSPVLHYNALQGDLVGGAFWDMRATGLRLNSPLAEQAQGPPLDPNEMALIDAACVVYRASERPYRSMAERLWGAQPSPFDGRRIFKPFATGRGRRRKRIPCQCIWRRWIVGSRNPPSTRSQTPSRRLKGPLK